MASGITVSFLRTPQQVLLTVLPPTPNPQTCPIMASQFAPPLDQRPHIVSGTMPHTCHPAPITVPGTFPPTPPIKPTIPNWARPAVPPPAPSRPMMGLFCEGKPHWPPPRPERKTIPFKKKPQTKPAADNRKDFLRPP